MLARRVLLQCRSLHTVSSLLRSTPAQLVSVRTVRAKVNNNEDQKKETSGDSTDNSEGTDPKKAQFELTQEQLKKLRFFGLLTFVTSGVLSYFLMKRMFGSDPMAAGDPIPFDQFVQKFLKAGEVRGIIYSPTQRAAMATLYEGAMIDGQVYPHKVVLVKTAEGDADGKRFEADLRRVEESLGVKAQERVPVSVLEGMSARKMAELVVGLAILFFIFGQYGRLARAKLAQAKNAQK